MMSTFTLSRKTCQLPVIDSKTGEVISNSFVPICDRQTLNFKYLVLYRNNNEGDQLLVPARDIISFNDICIVVTLNNNDKEENELINNPDNYLQLLGENAPTATSLLGGVVESAVYDFRTFRLISLATATDNNTADIKEAAENVTEAAGCESEPAPIVPEVIPMPEEEPDAESFEDVIVTELAEDAAPEAPAEQDTEVKAIPAADELSEVIKSFVDRLDGIEQKISGLTNTESAVIEDLPQIASDAAQSVDVPEELTLDMTSPVAAEAAEIVPDSAPDIRMPEAEVRTSEMNIFDTKKVTEMNVTNDILSISEENNVTGANTAASSESYEDVLAKVRDMAFKLDDACERLTVLEALFLELKSANPQVAPVVAPAKDFVMPAQVSEAAKPVTAAAAEIPKAAAPVHGAELNVDWNSDNVIVPEKPFEAVNATEKSLSAVIEDKPISAFENDFTTINAEQEHKKKRVFWKNSLSQVIGMVGFAVAFAVMKYFGL